MSTYETIGQWNCANCGVTKIAHTDAFGYECHGCGGPVPDHEIEEARL